MPSHRPHPPGKSKTALRRGHFTPGHPAARKDTTPRSNTATTHAEQSLLFDEVAAHSQSASSASSASAKTPH